MKWTMGEMGLADFWPVRAGRQSTEWTKDKQRNGSSCGKENSVVGIQTMTLRRSVYENKRLMKRGMLLMTPRKDVGIFWTGMAMTIRKGSLLRLQMQLRLLMNFSDVI
ncbi:hypothetical protein ACRALDRAFT_1077830 [Sodiomyces alcalophilus JCM 7366]|uniref:uncharacterized protein n=1 Tax=Sodiomyces alcalophilus JCM 7366 TaxID=591952 RepID=UPI0039B3D85B